MGLFDFLKKNKNIITDNGTNFIYYNEGKGKLKEKFNKLNGKLHGSYIKYDSWGSISYEEEYNNGLKVLSAKEKEDIKNYNNKWNSNNIFIINLIEIDNLISEITGANLILQLQNSTLNSYASLLENNSLKYYEGELFKVYLYYKRNFLIKHFISANIINELIESDLNILFTSHLNDVKNEIDKEVNNLPKNIARFQLTLSRSLKVSLINKILFEKVTKNKLISSFYEVQRASSQKYFKLTPEEFSKNIFHQDSLLFGINPDILLQINKIISDAQEIVIIDNQSKKFDSEYEKFANSMGLQDPDDLFAERVELFEKLLSNYFNEIKNICNLNKINQDEILLEINKINFDDLEKKSKLFINNISKAVEFYKRGLEKDLNSDYEGAIVEFTKAIEIDGEYIDAYRDRASAKWCLKYYEGAISDYTKIIELNSEDSDAYESRGLAKASLKNYIGAIEDFNKSIELDKESKVYSSRGRMKKNLLDYNGAMLDYNIAVEKFPEEESSYFGRGELKYAMADYHGAIIDFNKCIEIKPNRIIFIDKRADCRLKIEDYTGAIEDYSKSIQNRQDKYGVDRPPSENATKLLASLYHNRGIASSKIKKHKEAISDFKNAMELNPKCVDDVKVDIEMAIKQLG